MLRSFNLYGAKPFRNETRLHRKKFNAQFAFALDECWCCSKTLSHSKLIKFRGTVKVKFYDKANYIIVISTTKLVSSTKCFSLFINSEGYLIFIEYFHKFLLAVYYFYTKLCRCFQIIIKWHY